MLPILFFIIAFLYATVGFGGGSSYIALLLFYGMAVEEVRFTALVCNVVVVGLSTFRFHQAGFIPWKKILPLVAVSVPFAFIGGTIKLEGDVYKSLAGILLVLAAVMMLSSKKESSKTASLSTTQLSGVGGGIGFFSGLIGIGGGIFLSPLLHLIRWETAKVISATASIFILVNSLAGLGGQLTNPPAINYQQLITLALCVGVGGILGNQLNIKVLPAKYVRLITAILVGFVGVRLLVTSLY